MFLMNFLHYVNRHIILMCFIVLSSLGDISPPRGVRAAMEMQAEAERKKRAQILESEGKSILLVVL